ncbi:MAG TPA: fumarylacetoacetate hydrolase family protein [Negativicutes bacterium]|nr:fumarylacetoacetate hydrolase family protein [Negativicutes bacterium]
MRKSAVVFITLALFVFGTAAASAGVPEMADQLMNAFVNKEPTPLVTVTNAKLDLKTAYDVQKAYVQQRLAGDSPAGFKAGFTNKAVQKKFGVAAPAAGVLYAKGLYTGEPVIAAAGSGLVIEVEIGFVVGEEITEPVKDVAELKEKVSGVMPAIELPSMRFANMKLLKGLDVIAADVGADGAIAGKEVKAGDVDLNALVVTLYRDGKFVHMGRGADALGDQWATALWLVNTMVKQGYEIKPGQILITGALGQVVPAAAGHYEAYWGPLGKIAFDIL